MKTTGRLWTKFGQFIRRAEADKVDAGICGGYWIDGKYYVLHKYSCGVYGFTNDKGEEICHVDIYA